VRIREERPADFPLIHRLTEVAFEPMEFSDGSEPGIIDRLRAAGDLKLSLVAEHKANDSGDDSGNYSGIIIGHVAFSAVVVGEFDKGWYGLGPVSVHPDHQRKGIGGLLIEHGLQMLRETDAQGCVLVGDPAYYSRFGFKSDSSIQYEDLPGKFVHWMSFGDVIPSGEVEYAPAFSK